MAAARGEFIILLNNDAVVTDGWAEQLVALAKSDPTIGLVGPMSNYAPPPQCLEGVPYADLAAMHLFAARWRAEHLGQWFTCAKLSGFCLLLTRELYVRVGGLDERFGLGFFDDDDLAERARRAGYQLAVAHDLFVHHFGSRTFAGLGIDANELLRANLRAFAEKWGRDAVSGMKEVEIRPWVAHDGAREEVRPRGLDAPYADTDTITELPPRQVRVSLTMIVRNEENNLPACLDSVAGVFDEIIVLDTGSTDRTREIARERGARVFDFVWVNDFGAARNASLARVTGDFAFWLDADDVVEPPQRVRLMRLLASLRPGQDTGFVVRCSCDPDEKGGGGRTVVDHVRLFPVREDVRWSYRIHEQILPALNRVGVPIRWTDVTVRHTGYSDSATRQRKLDRDQNILLAELAEDPDEPFVLFNMGCIANERQNWEASLDYFQRSLAASRPEASITRKIYSMIAHAHQFMGNLDAALAACERGLGEVLEPQGLAGERAVAGLTNGRAIDVYDLTLEGVRVTLVPTASSRASEAPDRWEGTSWLDLGVQVLERFRPDVVLTYGGHPAGLELMRQARQRKIPVVFHLHNLAYDDRRALADASVLLFPSPYARRHYRRRLGIDGPVLPDPLRPERVVAENPEPTYVTFVNPQSVKGVTVFARIAHELARRRPEIPLLVVEGRSGSDGLARLPIDLSGLSNLHRMANTIEPRDFWRVTRAVLMPSLWRETLGRVAMEGLANGVPVLASDRGALPETLGNAGFVFTIPEQYVPDNAAVPTVREVAP